MPPDELDSLRFLLLESSILEAKDEVKKKKGPEVACESYFASQNDQVLRLQQSVHA